MDIQSEAYDFRNLHKITNKMVYNLFGNNLLPRFMLTAPDYQQGQQRRGKGWKAA